MINIETILLCIIIVVCIYVTYTDFREGLIGNKILVYAVCIGGVLNAIYYTLYANNYLILYLTNLVIISIFAILLYAYHIWAAGDSKLLIVIMSLIPGRLYDGDTGIASAITIIIIIFSIAYLYIVFESLYLHLRNRDKIQISKISIDIIRIIKQYIFCTAYIIAVDTILEKFFPVFFEWNMNIIYIANLFIIITVVNNKIVQRYWLLIIAIVISLILGRENLVISRGDIDFKLWIIIFIVIIFRIVAEKHNYKTIRTEDTKKGMVLSFSTILYFQASRIKGLPMTTTEDIRSRISEEESNSIKRWGRSVHGRDTITIVKKIPFAVFISVGSSLFIIYRVNL